MAHTTLTMFPLGATYFRYCFRRLVRRRELTSNWLGEETSKTFRCRNCALTPAPVFQYSPTELRNSCRFGKDLRSRPLSCACVSDSPHLPDEYKDTAAMESTLQPMLRRRMEPAFTDKDPTNIYFDKKHGHPEPPCTVTIWHAHPCDNVDDLQGHVDTLRVRPDISIFTSHEGRLVRQWLNGKDMKQETICGSGRRNCLPLPRL